MPGVMERTFDAPSEWAFRGRSISISEETPRTTSRTASNNLPLQDLGIYYRTMNEEERNPHPAVISTELVGFEVELENAGGAYLSSTDWNSKPDGSLRNNGVEFVMRRPRGGDALVASVFEFARHIKRYDVDASWRCSTHMHVNARNMSVNQLKRLILAYIIFEKVMFKCGCMNRYYSNFCVPMKRGQYLLTVLAKHWNREGTHFVNTIASEWSKYTALNLCPLTHFGSVELRIANGMTDPNDLLQMANRFLAIKKVAMEWEGPDTDMIEYLRTNWSKHLFHKTLTSDDPIGQQDIEEGVRLAYDVIEMSQYSEWARNNLVYESTMSRERFDSLLEYISNGYGSESTELVEMNNINFPQFTHQEVKFVARHTGMSLSNMLSDSDVAAFLQVNV